MTTYPNTSEPKYRRSWTVTAVRSLILKILGKEVKEMIAVIYASLIIKGRKKFSDVPASIREQVKQILIDLDCAELAE